MIPSKLLSLSTTALPSKQLLALDVSTAETWDFMLDEFGGAGGNLITPEIVPFRHLLKVVLTCRVTPTTATTWRYFPDYCMKASWKHIPRCAFWSLEREKDVYVTDSIQVYELRLYVYYLACIQGPTAHLLCAWRCSEIWKCSSKQDTRWLRAMTFLLEEEQ